MHFLLDPILTFIHGDGLIILPHLELLLFALGILLFDFLLEPAEKSWNAGLALIAVAAGAVGLFLQAQRYSEIQFRAPSATGESPVLFGFHQTVVVDGFSLLFSALFLCATGLAILLSIRYLQLQGRQAGEYYSLLLCACIGMLLMVSAIDLVVLLLGLELMTISLYILSGFLVSELSSNEASIKFFLLGGFSTAVITYGFSLLYGLSGGYTDIREIAFNLDRRFQLTSARGLTDWLVVLAFVCIVAGLFGKVAAVPFHQWFPDVAHGAPTPVSLYIGVAGLSAAVAVFVRLVLVVFGGSQPTWAYAVAAVALVTLVWGNLAALSQRNLKRLLAYATIANVGFLLFALVAANLTGLVAIAWSLFSNLFATAGIFAILLIVSGGKDNSAGEELDDLNGLYQRSPMAAILLLLFAASLAGFPPTAGFLAKYFLVQSLIESDHPVLAGLLALGILPFVYSAFRIVQHAWIKHPAPSAETAPPVITLVQTVALTIAAFVTLVAGCYPEPFTRLARYAFGQ